MAENTTPSWLEESFIRKVLQLVEDTSDYIEPVKTRCKEALPAGSNNLSRVFRVSIDYKVPVTSTFKTTSLFVKLPLTSGFVAEFAINNKLYEKEIKIYGEILPKMYSLGFATLTPISYSVTPMKNSLVLEDLCHKGYKMLNRLEQTDFQHCVSVLKTLAMFHALTVALHNREPELIETLGANVLFNLKSDHSAARSHINKLLNYFATTLSEIGCENYAQMVRERIDSYWDKTANILKPGKALNVLSHGDCWMVNAMFKYENEKIVDTKLVDFQCSFYSGFAYDIMTFWWTSADDNVRENHKEELFEVYRTALNESLAELQCHETLTKEDFDSEMKMIAPYALYVIGCFAPICLAEHANDCSTTKKSRAIDSDSREQGLLDLWGFQSKYYRSALPKLMEHGERFGMFD